MSDKGTIVHQQTKTVFEVEFVNEHGDTLALCNLERNQFVIVWQAEKKQKVPLSEQVPQEVALLPHQAGTELLDFARFLSSRQAQQATSSPTVAS